MITAMSFNFYHLIRLLSTLVILHSVGSYYPVFGQLVELTNATPEIILEELSPYTPKEEAYIGYTARGQTLTTEGFEEFTVLSDRTDNAILEYAVSGRWGYMHIRACNNMKVRKVKKAIKETCNFFDDIEGIILDIRYSSVDEASQNDWLKYISQEIFSGPVILLSSASFTIPDNWHHLLPWQFSPGETNDVVTTDLTISQYSRKYAKIKDVVILSALRKLRQPIPFKDFGALW